MANKQCSISHRLAVPSNQRLQIKNYNIFSQSNNDFLQDDQPQTSVNYSKHLQTTTNNNHSDYEDEEFQRQRELSLKDISQSNSMISKYNPKFDKSNINNQSIQNQSSLEEDFSDSQSSNRDIQKVFSFLRKKQSSQFLRIYEILLNLKQCRNSEVAFQNIQDIQELLQTQIRIFNQNFENLVNSFQNDLNVLQRNIQKYLITNNNQYDSQNRPNLFLMQQQKPQLHVIGAQSVGSNKDNESLHKNYELYVNEIQQIIQEFLLLAEKQIYETKQNSKNLRSFRQQHRQNNNQQTDTDNNNEQYEDDSDSDYEGDQENLTKLYYNNSITAANKGRKNNQIRKNDELKLDEDEQEDFQSDFSDENFDIETEQEKISLQLISDLKAQIEDPNIYREVQEILKYPNENYVYVFHDIINIDLGLQKSQIEIDCLLERLNYSTSTVNEIRFDQTAIQNLFERIQKKSINWFRQRIAQDGVEVNYANFNFKSFNSNKNSRRDLTLSVLIEKLITYNSNNGINETTKEICKAMKFIQEKTKEQSFLLKKEIRTLILENQYPLSRKECKILFYILDYSGQGQIQAEDLISVLFENPAIVFQICDLLPNYRDQESYLESLEMKALALIQKIKVKIDEKQIDQTTCIDNFRLQDKAFKNRMGLQAFYSCFTDNCFPLDRKEVETIFKYLHESQLRRPMRTRNFNNITVDYTVFLNYLFTRSSQNHLLNEIKMKNLKNQSFQHSFYQQNPRPQSNYLSNINQISTSMNSIHPNNQQIENNSNRSINTEYPTLRSLNNNLNNNFSNRNNNNANINHQNIFNQYSQEKIHKTQLDFLEHENALFRKKINQKNLELEKLDQNNRELNLKIQEIEKSHIQQINLLNQRNLNFIRDNYLHKEMEQMDVIVQQSRKSEIQMELLKKKFETEKNQLKRIIDVKNEQVNSYRRELEGILEELEYTRKTQRNAMGNGDISQRRKNL